MNNVYLLLGSNLANPQQQLSDARDQITIKIGKIVNQSSLYETDAWGKTDQPGFINQVILVSTGLNAHEILKMIFRIESNMGRTRTEKYAARVIDIDILYFNQAVIDSDELIVPHPAMQDRRFVLVPLSEIAPSFIHPVAGKSNLRLLESCADKLMVKRI